MSLLDLDDPNQPGNVLSSAPCLELLLMSLGGSRLGLDEL